MLRGLNIALIVVLLAGAGWTFKVKGDADSARQKVARLEQRIRTQREAIEILKADWSLLTSPQRLEKLAARYQEELGLEPAKPERIGEIGDIPHSWEAPASDADGPREGHADAGNKDAAVTGSIRRESQ